MRSCQGECLVVLLALNKPSLYVSEQCRPSQLGHACHSLTSRDAFDGFLEAGCVAHVVGEPLDCSLLFYVMCNVQQELRYM